jgi:hypothetical protein
MDPTVDDRTATSSLKKQYDRKIMQYEVKNQFRKI